jgi:hypothetical protein
VATNAQKWLIGCGAGCLVVILALTGLGIGGFFFVRDIVEEVGETTEVRARLVERHGRPSAYRPEADSSIPAERLEAFLKAREIMAPARDELDRTLSLLSEKGRRRIIPKIGAGVGLISQVIEYDGLRSEALLEVGMGLGEYEHLYALIFYVWLGKSPADGPPFELSGDDEDDHEERDEFDVREDRRARVLSRLNTLLLAHLRNQLAALPQAEPDEAEEAGETWSARLEAEIEALEGDPYRLPWIDSLPPALEESLRPFRQRLEESYSPLCNPTEMNLFREDS